MVGCATTYPMAAARSASSHSSTVFAVTPLAKHYQRETSRLPGSADSPSGESFPDKWARAPRDTQVCYRTMGRTSCPESSCSPFLFSYFFLFFLIVNADRAGSGKRPCRKQPHRRRPCRHTWSAAAGLVRRIPNSANLKWENAANQIALKPTEDIVQNYVQDHVKTAPKCARWEPP